MTPTVRRTCALAVWTLCLFVALGADATVRFVDADAISGGDGLSWTTAHTHPQTALDAAAAGDEIWVKEGTYGVRSAGDLSVVALATGVALYGGFDGTETSLGQRDPTAHETILDGAGVTEHVVIGADAARLDGFTVTGAAPYTVCCLSMGGGMLIDGVDPTVSQVIFRDNSSHSAAAVYIHNASPLIEDSRFEDNAAETGGGAITVWSGLPEIHSSTFLRNRAVMIQGRGGSGGAIHVLSGRLTIEDSTFEGNHAEFDGGAIQVEDSVVIRRATFLGNFAATGGAIRAESASPALTIEDSTFTGNFNTTTTRIICDPFPPVCHPVPYGGTGGALYDHDSGVQVHGSTFAENQSDQGGAVYVERAATRLEDSTFSGNLATLYGGAVRNLAGAPVIERSTFDGNEGAYGGAIYVEAQLSGQNSIRIRDTLFQENYASSSGGAVTIAVAYGEIERSRFLDNDAEGSGGAIFAYDNTGVQTPITFRNVLFAGNRAANGGGMANSSACIRATVINATFADNEATVQGGALDNATCGTSTYTNAIFWGDTAPTAPEIAGSAGVTHSDVAGGFPGMGNIALDPLFFGPLAGNYHLGTGSPAIDAGTESGAPIDDLDGRARPFDGDGDGVPVTDMGAYEYSGPFCDDEDGDGVCDDVDVCTLVPDPDQTDADGDGFGNRCDGDFNQDGFVGGPDFSTFLACFNRMTGPGVGPPDDPACEESDMNADGFVGGPDFGLFLDGFNGPPGPAGV